MNTTLSRRSNGAMQARRMLANSRETIHA
jgi:hypothetical protein